MPVSKCSSAPTNSSPPASQTLRNRKGRDARNKVQWSPGNPRLHPMPPKNQPPLIIKDKQALMPVCQPWPGNNPPTTPPLKLSPQTLNVIDTLAQKIAERVEEKVSDLLEHMAPPVLPVVRVGRRVHLDRRDLDIWIEKNKV